VSLISGFSGSIIVAQCVGRIDAERSARAKRVPEETFAVTQLLNRRIFLRGLGGACVAAPFLGSLAGRAARAQAPAAPRRLIVLFTHYGCITTRFFPKKSHGPLTAADLEPTTLKPLAPYVDKLLMPRGIRAMNEWTADMVRGQGNDPHTQVVGSYFTCQPVSPNSNNPFDFGDAKFRAMPLGPSLDHVMARQLSPDGVPLFIRVGPAVDGPSTAISYAESQTLYKGSGNLEEIFASLTGLFNGGAMSPDTYQAIRGKSIVDLVKHDLDALQRLDMSQSDKNKLEAWKTLLHETGGVVAAGSCSEEIATKLGLSPESFNGLRVPSTATSDRLTTRVTASLDGADLHSNVAVLAALCNANPVIFLKYPPDYTFSGLGVYHNSANLNRRQDQSTMVGPCLPGAVDLLLRIDDYYARKFAHLVEQLNSFDEGDGTLLDNAAAVWFHESSDGAAVNLNNLPIVQVGSAGGYFKTGWAVNVEDGSADLTPGNSEGACVEGTPSEIDGIHQVTGTDPSLANAPINKYYCNLMNALGVKAGPDGFPLPGGMAEVTHFGRYDKTEDFIGGATNPPVIHDPGEFAALRAT
jgi:hypothetical protein